nr:hypothetical protein [uncultured Rhodoferax sp.]
MDGLLALLIVVGAVAIAVFSTSAKSAPKKPITTSFDEDVPVSLSKRKYPRLTTDMIETGGKAVTAATAVTLYKEYMLKVGYLEKIELKYYANQFKEAMNHHAENLRDEVEFEKTSASENAHQNKQEIRRAQFDLAQAKTDTERVAAAEWLAILEETQEEMDSQDADIAKAQEAKNEFRADKRQFLIDYVNRQVQDLPA